MGRRGSRSRRRTTRRGSPAPAVMAVAEGMPEGRKSGSVADLCAGGFVFFALLYSFFFPWQEMGFPNFWREG